MKYNIKVTPNRADVHPHDELNNIDATYRETLDTLDLFGFAPNYELVGTYGEETDTHTVIIKEDLGELIEKPKAKRVRTKKVI
jgi:hypothetical protein